MGRVALVTAPAGAPRHDTGPGHPEKPERIDWILGRLERGGLLPRFARLDAAPADPSFLEAVHAPDYIRRVERTCRRGDLALDSTDTAISPGSYDAALYSAGGALALCDEVAAGRADSGFAATRPPGHHAEAAVAMGFCLFNNIAVAARYLQKRHGLERILIVDWDLHHGNGTQHSFEEDPSILYTSLHQWPWYPGTGAAEERGRGKGAGTTLNLPMPAGAGDAEYRRAFDEAILPAAARFKPEAVLISAGFDAHREDPLGAIGLSDEQYGWMTRRLTAFVRETGAIGPVSLLEGGYHPEAMPRSVEAHLGALLDA